MGKKKKQQHQLLPLQLQLKSEQADERHRKSEREYIERLLGPTICVRPAPGGKEFHLHALQLQKKSDYFKCQQSSGLRESKDRESSFNFTPGACAAFEAVAQYLYVDEYEPKGSSEAARCIEAAYVFVLADRLLMSELKSLALAKLYNIFDASADEVEVWHVILSQGCYNCDCYKCKKWRQKQQQEQTSSGCSQCICYQCRLWREQQQQENLDKPAMLNVTSESALLDSEQIKEMKEVLYDNYIEVDDKPEPRTFNEAMSPESETEPMESALGSKNLVPRDADQASEAAVSDADSDWSGSHVYANPLRSAQLAFSKHLSQHLPALQANAEFKHLLASGALDGPFMVDLLCTHQEAKVEKKEGKGFCS